MNHQTFSQKPHTQGKNPPPLPWIIYGLSSFYCKNLKNILHNVLDLFIIFGSCPTPSASLLLAAALNNWIDSLQCDFFPLVFCCCFFLKGFLSNLADKVPDKIRHIGSRVIFGTCMWKWMLFIRITWVLCKKFTAENFCSMDRLSTGRCLCTYWFARSQYGHIYAYCTLNITCIICFLRKKCSCVCVCVYWCLHACVVSLNFLQTIPHQRFPASEKSPPSLSFLADYERFW